MGFSCTNQVVLLFILCAIHIYEYSTVYYAEPKVIHVNNTVSCPPEVIIQEAAVKKPVNVNLPPSRMTRSVAGDGKVYGRTSDSEW